MKSILVVDDMPVFREPIAASLRLAGYETRSAADGEEALKLTRAHHPDLILLDIAMPKMDGLTFLKHLRADVSIAKTRVILLTAHGEKKQVISAGYFGVKDYLLKSRFRLADLLDRIERPSPSVVLVPQKALPETAPPNPVPVISAQPISAPVAAGSKDIPVLMTRDQFLEKVNKVFQTKTLSGVVAEVIGMASSARCDMAQLASLISRDPMLSARILQAANSALYASAGPAVTNVPAAIRKVGCTTVRNIAAALGVFDCIPDAGADGFNPIRCWQHSFAVAQLCEKLASINTPDQSGLAYMVGLCHDLGDIFIRTQFSKEYGQLIETAMRTSQSVEQLHGQMFGMTPVQMISAVLKCISLPEAIRKPIEIHHTAIKPQTPHPLAQILWMAENYANAAMLASGPNSEVAPITNTLCRAVVGDKPPPHPDPQTLRAEVQALTVALARLSRAEEAKLLAPMFNSQKSRIWVARAAAVSAFDPIALALQSIAEVVVNKQLPSDKEIETIDGLVVVAPSATAVGFSKQNIDQSLAKARSAGRTIPILTLAAEMARDHKPTDGLSWRSSITLSELNTFTASLAKANVVKAAA